MECPKCCLKILSKLESIVLNDTPKYRSGLSKMVLLQCRPCRTGDRNLSRSATPEALCSTGLQYLGAVMKTEKCAYATKNPSIGIQKP
jgi:hypothetical protein